MRTSSSKVTLHGNFFARLDTQLPYYYFTAEPNGMIITGTKTLIFSLAIQRVLGDAIQEFACQKRDAAPSATSPPVPLGFGGANDLGPSSLALQTRQ